MTNLDLNEERPRQPVSLYRLRERYAAEYERKFPRENGISIRESMLVGGFFYPIPAEPEPPGWLAAVKSILPPEATIQLASVHPSGLLLVEYQQKHFVFSFGHAWSSLKEEWLEPTFGIHVALNSIPRNQLTELKAEQVFAAWHLSSERAPAPTSVAKFGLEAERDLVHAIEGKPSSAIASLLGSTIRGAVSLKISIDFLRLREILDLIISLEQKSDYKSIWPEIDNLALVRDQNLTTILDLKLDTAFIGSSAATTIMLVAPTLKNSDGPVPSAYIIGSLRSSKKNGPVTCPYLMIGNWDSYLKKKNTVRSTENAKITAVHFLSETNEVMANVRLYDCVGFETTINSATEQNNYVLSAGRWYEASNNFIANVNNTISSLSAPIQHQLKVWDNVADEGAYNLSCVTPSNGLFLFDAKNINFGGGQSKFEFCDLFHEPSKTLYFVKHVGASNHFSHLGEQVRRTVELVFGPDDAFRLALLEKISKLYPVFDASWLGQRPRQGDFHLCIVSMGKHYSNYPFFAKCGLARLTKELQHANYNVTFLAV